MNPGSETSTYQLMTATKKIWWDDSCMKNIRGWQQAAWKISGNDSCMTNIGGWKPHERYQWMTAEWKISVDESCMKDISGWQLNERYQWMTADWKISVDDSWMKDISGWQLQETVCSTRHLCETGCWESYTIASYQHLQVEGEDQTDLGQVWGSHG